MSKIRGVLPLFLATSIGIVNGEWSDLILVKRLRRKEIAYTA